MSTVAGKQGDTATRGPLVGLLVSQFFGAFNDNAWKLVVTFLGLGAIRARLGETDPAFEGAAQSYTTLAFVVFTLPLIILSLPAGVLADRFSKRRVILWMKGLEMVLMASGTLVLLLAPSQAWLLLVVLAMMGVQSSLFSPAKYGILPELLPHDRLSAGNAALETWTVLAIIAGTAAAGVIVQSSGTELWLAGLLLTGLSVVGFLAALRIPMVAPARSGEVGLADTVTGAWRAIRADRVLWLTVLGSTFFWALASLLGQNILVYGKTRLQLSDASTGVLVAVYGVGIAGGSLLAARWSAGKVETGVIPLGALGFSFMLLMLGVLAPGLVLTLLLMVLLGVASGLVLVPLESLLQWRSAAAASSR